MFHMTNNTGMYDVNWFTNDKHTFIEKCLVDNENLDQIGNDNCTYMYQRKQPYHNPPNKGPYCRTPKHRNHGFEHWHRTRVVLII